MYQGPADRDDTLKARLAEHRFPDGNEHFGALATVSEKSWDDPEKRKGILAEMANARGAGQGEGFGQAFYDVKSTFTEDAYHAGRASTTGLRTAANTKPARRDS